MTSIAIDEMPLLSLMLLYKTPCKSDGVSTFPRRMAHTRDGSRCPTNRPCSKTTFCRARGLGVQQLGWHRHGAEDALAAFLQALEHHHPAGQVDLPGGEGQGFGNPAAGGVQGAAKGAHLPWGFGGGG